jgi:hypothetical protein
MMMFVSSITVMILMMMTKILGPDCPCCPCLAGGVPHYLIPTRNRYGIIGPIPGSSLTPQVRHTATVCDTKTYHLWLAVWRTVLYAATRIPHCPWWLCM